MKIHDSDDEVHNKITQPHTFASVSLHAGTLLPNAPNAQLRKLHTAGKLFKSLLISFVRASTHTS